MDKEQFLAADANSMWFLQPVLSESLETLRRQIGASFGWTDPLWYTDKTKLESLYGFLAPQGTQVFQDLQLATDDTRQTQWLDSVVEMKKKSDSPPKSSESTQTAPTAPKPPTAAAPPKPRPSAFGGSGAAPPGGDGGSAPSPGAATTGAAPAKKSIFKPKDEPAPVQGQIDEAVKTVMSDLSGGGLTGLASELDISAEELQSVLQDPDFERLVAEEAAKLAAEGS
jgi:hypothetical protein